MKARENGKTYPLAVSVASAEVGRSFVQYYIITDCSTVRVSRATLSHKRVVPVMVAFVTNESMLHRMHSSNVSGRNFHSFPFQIV